MAMIRNAVAALVAALGCLTPGEAGGYAAAQEGLVLSGGGSRGLAHVGVLTALEDAGHDPDIVVGTSMGAVIGALYAAGYTPEEIRERVLAIDWAEVFTATGEVLGPDRVARYPMITFDLDIGELRVARGLVAQWRINRALVHLLFGANSRAGGDFDRLARRYRAVAADLRTGEAVILASGDLARAARASMAVPGLFAPVSWDGHLLVDGGIVKNLPTDVARSLGADRVIAVEVSRPPEEIHDRSPFGVFQRALDLMQENTQRDAPPDELVLPEIDPGLNASTFPSDPRPLFEIGRRAGIRDLSRALSTPARPQRWQPTAPDTFTALVVEAPDSSLASLGRAIFSEVAPGPYAPDAVLRAVDLLYNTGLFEAVWPRVVPDSVTGEPVLLVRLDAPPAVSIAAAGAYDNDRGGRAWASLTRYTSAARRPAVLTGAATVGGLDRWASASLRVYPRIRPAIIWSIGGHVRERDVRSFENDAVGDRDALRAGGWAGIELPHVLRDRVGTLSAVGEWVRVEEGSRGWAIGPSLRFSAVNPEVLVVGEPFLVEAEHRWGDLSYSRVTLATSLREDDGRLKLAATGDFRWTGGDAPDDVRPALGDDQAIPGLRWGEVRGGTRMVVGADVAYPIRTAHGRLRIRAGGVARHPSGLGETRWLTGAQVAAVWRLPIGLAELALGASSRGDRRIDVSFGRRF